MEESRMGLYRIYCTLWRVCVYMRWMRRRLSRAFWSVFEYII
jgi:hypothetical protein